MHPVLVEALRFVHSGWWGLSCPDHCAASSVFLLSIFVAGLCLGSLLTLLCGFFPQQRKLGVSAKLGTGALWGSHPVRFPEVPRFRVKVPKVPSEGSEVPSKGSE